MILTEEELKTPTWSIQPGEKLSSKNINRAGFRIKFETNLLDNYRKYTMYGNNADIPAYNAAKIYEKDELVKDTVNNLIYKSLSDNNVGNALTVSIRWYRMIPESATRLDLVFDTLNIQEMHYTNGLLSVVEYVTGNRINMSYNADKLLTLAEYTDTDGVTVLADNELTYNVNKQLSATVWTKYY